jgi:uncharacterized protein (DUF486 family)
MLNLRRLLKKPLLLITVVILLGQQTNPVSPLVVTILVSWSSGYAEYVESILQNQMESALLENALEKAN